MLLTIAYALATVIPAWEAALIVGLTSGGVALGLISLAKQRFGKLRIDTEQSIEKVAQNVKVDVARLANIH